MTVTGPNDGDEAARLPRYGWDFEAVDAFVELSTLYMGCSEFLQDVRSLRRDAPERFKKLGIDPLFGVIPEDEEYFPSHLDIALPFKGKADPYPGDIAQVTERYEATWHSMTSFLDPDDRWLRRVEEAVDDWGLRASWGPGAFLEMMVESEVLRRRAKGDVPEAFRGLATTWMVRRTPKPFMGEPFLFAPNVRPGMTDAQWNEEVEEFRLEGLRILKQWRDALSNTGLWRARPLRMRMHVEWLFRRITPPYLLPENLVKYHSDVSVHAVRAANRKTAKLLGLEIPSGTRRSKKHHQERPKRIRE